MHNCGVFHKGKTHRRRNNALKHTLEPLRWFNDPRALSGEWGGVGLGLIELPERPKRPSKRSSKGLGSIITDFLGVGQGSPAPPETEQQGHVQLYQLSALRRLATRTQRLVLFTRRRSG